MTCAERSKPATSASMPNGISSATGLPDAMAFQIAVDTEITRLKDHGEPDALWLEELLPLYAAGVSPEEAASHIVAKRYPLSVHRKASCQQGSLIKFLLDIWREWDFRRALRQAGRA